MIAELLQCWGISATPNVRAAGEVDVAFAIDGIRFVVEAKWEKAKADTGRIAKLQKRVRQRLSGTYGVFLSMSGYSPEALADVADGDRLEVLLLDSEHWEAMLGGLVPPQELLNLVHDRASFYGEPYAPLAGLFPAVKLPDASFDSPDRMTEGPLLSAVDGVQAQVVLSGIDSGQLGIVCHGQNGLLITTENGIVDVDPVARTMAMAVPVPDCRRNPLVLDDGSIVFLRGHGVGLFRAGQITTIGGGFPGNFCLCRHPDGGVWVFDNGLPGTAGARASVTKLGNDLGDQQRYEIDYPPAGAFTSAWLSEDELLTIGNGEFLVSTVPDGSTSRHPAPQSNSMGLLVVDSGVVLTGGDNVSISRTDTTTWTSHELARVAVRPSVTELAQAADGDVYLAAYHESTGRNLSFAVVRLRVPSELDLSKVMRGLLSDALGGPADDANGIGDLDQLASGPHPGNGFARGGRADVSGREAASDQLDDAVRVLSVAQQDQYDRGYRDALRWVPSLGWNAFESLAAMDFDVKQWLTGWRNGWRDIELGEAPEGARVASWLPALADYLGSLADPIGYDRWSFVPSERYVGGFGAALRDAWTKTHQPSPAAPVRRPDPDVQSTVPGADHQASVQGVAPDPSTPAAGNLSAKRQNRRDALGVAQIATAGVVALFFATGLAVWLVTIFQGDYAAGTLAVAITLVIVSVGVIYGCIRLIRKEVRRRRGVRGKRG